MVLRLFAVIVTNVDALDRAEGSLLQGPLRDVDPKARRSAFGGGHAGLQGHGRQMQEVGRKANTEELSEMPSWHVFYKEYVRKNRPLVLRGAAIAQRAFGRWTDDYLLGLWGSRLKIDVELHKVEVRGFPDIRMPFGKFVREIYSDVRRDELYAVIDLEKEKKALADLALPAFARCMELWPQSASLWMSAGGTQSVLHQDDAENFLMLLAGNKSVMLVHQDQAPNLYAGIAREPGTSAVRQDSVDMEAFPMFSNISWLHAELDSGDILYIPHSYWHQVNSQGRNLAVNIWWQHREDFHWLDVDRFDGSAFGTRDQPYFDTVKAHMLESVPCTPTLESHDLSTTNFVDEDVTKERLRKLRRMHVTRRKTPRRSSDL